MVNVGPGKYTEKYLFFPLVLLAAMIPMLLGMGKYEYALGLTVIPLFFMVIFVFENYFRLFIIASTFLGYHFSVDFRIQLVNIISYLLIVYFIFNYRTDNFNKLKLPFLLKIISVWLIFAVFISAVRTPFASNLSVYYFVMFFIYIFTGYIIFRSVKNFKILENYLDYFYKSVALYGIAIIIAIFATGKIRSFGISGPTISDIIVIALLIAIFKSYLKGKVSRSNLIYILILFIVLITTLSRFSWIGFIMSFIYGIVLIMFNENNSIFSKKNLYIVLISLFLLFLLFVTGLYNLIIDRILDVNFDILDTTRDEGAVSNSLDSRILVWGTALNAFLHNKFSGVGYFMFHKVSYVYNIFPEELYVDFVMGLDPHSTFLGFLTETGLFGFSAFFLYLFTAFILSIRSVTLSTNADIKLNSFILSIILFFVFTTSFYSGAFTFGYNAYVLHTIVGLVVANYALIVKNKKNYIEILNN